MYFFEKFEIKNKIFIFNWGLIYALHISFLELISPFCFRKFLYGLKKVSRLKKKQNLNNFVFVGY